MTAYETVWGSADRDWRPVDYREKQIRSCLRALIWIAMLLFAFSAVGYLLTSTFWLQAVSVASLLLWIITGVLIIRMRRARQKAVQIW